MKLAHALLDSIISSGDEYSPVVFICKNDDALNRLIDNFKAMCVQKSIKLFDGCSMIISSDISMPKAPNNVCVLFENLQFMAGNSQYEKNFFDLFNILWGNHYPMLITLNQELKYLHFEDRNKARFHWGFIHTIE